MKINILRKWLDLQRPVEKKNAILMNVCFATTNWVWQFRNQATIESGIIKVPGCSFRNKKIKREMTYRD